MPRDVLTAKAGNNGIAVVVRDAESGRVSSFTITPREAGEDFLTFIGERVDVEIKYE